MSDALDLTPITARWAAATPGEWLWHDEMAQIPYAEVWLGGDTPVSGNDGTLGVTGLFIEIFETEDLSYLKPIIAIKAKVADTWSSRTREEQRDWRGLIQVANIADLECIVSAKTDIAALIAEVERLRALLPPV